jgi:tetratricopeptide (TPR) repeat protein
MRIESLKCWIAGATVVVAALVGGCKSGSTVREGTGTSNEKLGQKQQAKLQEANAAKDARDYETALGLFQEILAVNPTATSAYLGMGDIYLIKEDYPRAEPAYARAAKLEPRNFDAQYGHGLALQMLDRFIEAVRAYHRALTIDPDSVKANLNIATTYLQMSEPQSAVTFLEKAAALEPGNGSVRTNLGAAYERVGRNADAIDEYSAALELVDRRNAPPLMINLINVLAQEKRYQEAANTAENLVKLEPTSNAYERLGWCWFRLSQFEKSMTAYKEAVKIDREHWQSHNGIGVNAINTWLLSKKKDQDAEREARDAFRRSLRANPDQPKLIALMSNYGL